MVWLRNEIPPTEEGKQQWQQVVAWINAPPAAAVRASPGASQPRAVIAGAPVGPDAEAAAFAASMAARG